jgi:L-ascorbate metabolism protein UlaG (beta-lactamase superfamily)
MKYVRHLLFASLFIIIIASTSICADSDMIIVEWYGHSCFLLTLENDYKILIDPFSTDWVPYQAPSGSVNVTFSSHDHFDHNAVDIVPSDYVLRAAGTDATFFGTKKGEPFEGQETFSFDLGGIEMTCATVPSFHDERQGELRGPNGIIRFDVAGMSFVHLGDLGHTLTPNQIELLKPVDVLMVPVGGYYTIDADMAQQVVASLSPRVVIPMHFKTEVLEEGFPIANAEPFLEGFSRINRHTSSAMTLKAEALPDSITIDVLRYHGQE